jgi:hypothetical protein
VVYSQPLILDIESSRPKKQSEPITLQLPRLK